MQGAGYIRPNESEDQMKLPSTLTEAKQRSGAIFVLGKSDATFSNIREISYGERYRFYTGVMETPIEHIQKAARDEQERAKHR